MLFNSFEFLLFFPIVTILFYLLPHSGRWSLLLAASCFFYMFFKPEYILILGFTIVVDYYAGILLEQEADQKKKKKYLVMSLIANIGVLAVFKYYNFINGNITGVAALMGFKNHIPFLEMALPIGLSFHTFQAMSYTIEVYRGNQKAERHFGIYSLYVMFYPQLVAGPIERPQNVLHQFHEKHEFSYDNVASGLRQMAWGLLKKAVIADRLAQIVDPIYNNPQSQSATGLCITTVLFAFEIYCDFSGYTDIALGSARVMGYHLMANFNKPYNAKSVTEFWRKWHISLSSWLSDYVFNPIAINLRNLGLYAVVISALITFLISGLWHGASWNFVLWGGLHGIAIAYEIITKKSRKKLFKKIPTRLGELISQLLTFTFVCFTYIFFRANNLSDSITIVRKVPSVFSEWISAVRNPKIITTQLLAGLNMPMLLSAIFSIVVLEVLHKIEGTGKIYDMIGEKSKFARWVTYIVCFVLITYFGVFDNRQFVYFQF